KTCRRSDAMVMRYGSSSTGTLGRIARTLHYTSQTQGLTLVLDTADFYLNGRFPNNQLLEGVFANKVGRSTGWSNGRIDETCIGSLHQYMPANTWLLCQYTAWNHLGVTPDSNYVAPGDSGSPVFATVDYQEYSGGMYWLQGILWGESGSPNPNHFNAHT